MLFLLVIPAENQLLYLRTPRSPSLSSPAQIAVIGAGAFGRNHLRVWSELSSAHPDELRLAALVDTDESRRTTYATTYNIPAFASVAELLGSGIPVHAASVCVPTIHHTAVAADLLRAGIDVLIEKPFAATLDEADHIISLAREHSRIVAIGHLERFNPAVTATLAELSRPMFFESHRLSVFTPRSLDVDVVLDLMIHDLDIVLALVNSPVRELRAAGIAVLSRRSDIANVRIEFESGCIANFTASRVSTEQVRKLRLFQPQQYLSLDFARQELLSISVDPAMALAFRNVDVPKSEPLRLELEDFLHAVRTRTEPRVTAAAGRRALALALEINRQIADHAHRAGLA